MASSVEDSRRLITCVGTLFRASQFLSEELPIRLAHRVQDLGELPDGLSEMPSIKKVQDWYAQSFEVCLLYPLFFFSLRVALFSSLAAASVAPWRDSLTAGPPRRLSPFPDPPSLKRLETASCARAA
jgi:pyruvate dehydrogenase kinase 2/3/4